MGRVLVVYERDLPHPLAEAYGWLTDYDDLDGDRAGALIRRRRVVERDDDRVVLETVPTVDGGLTRYRSVVTLHPPDAWSAEVQGSLLDGSRYTYHLEPRGDGACLLHVDYDVRVPGVPSALLRPGRGLVRSRLHRMWNGFAASMERELGEGEASRV